MTPGRQPCVISGCRRTRKADGTFAEWICAKHWHRVAPELRRAFNANKALVRRLVRRKPLFAAWWRLKPGSSDRLAALAMWRRHDALWARIKAAAAEEAFHG